VNVVGSFAQQLTAGGFGDGAAFGVAFLGGLVAGFGPCILPMIPAVFGYVTGQVADSKVPTGVAWLRAMALSATFVVGMSLVFAAIGAAAGALGHALIIGAWAYYVVAVICVLIGLQLLGLVNLHLDAFNRFLPARRPDRGGFAGAFVLGLLFGVVATPCSTPILAAIATIAAARGSALQGGLMLFVYGLGKGVPLLLVGLASGSLRFAGGFSRASGVLTKIGGVAMLGAAAYLIWIA
jgi:cytochrome c-type biogenesis protein